MYCCSSNLNNVIPHEYRDSGEALFPSNGYPEGGGPGIEAAEAFAEILGIGADYKRLLEENKSDSEMRRFLAHFQNNLDLLIQKTWVEKADEIRKEKLQDRVPGFIAGIERGNYRQALVEFGAILEELAYLFFGAQSHKEDFTEYTFRIDAQMGLFWWYGGRLCCLEKTWTGAAADDERLKALLLLGICYLTNF
jgi:hypothetical protein